MIRIRQILIDVNEYTFDKLKDRICSRLKISDLDLTGFSISNNNITMLKEMQKCADDKFHYLFNELIRIEKKRESCL